MVIVYFWHPMDHPCYKCGHGVAEGKPFCAQCGAPQIRVTSPPLATHAEADASPPADLPDHLPNPSPLSVLRDSPISPETGRKSAFWASAGAAVISIVLLSLRVVNPLFASLGAGAMAALICRLRNPAWSASARSGAQLGALSGLLISAVFAFFVAILVAVLHAGGDIRQQMLDSLREVGSHSNDAQAQAFLDLLKDPDALPLKLIAGVAGFLVISIAAGSLAGALTGALLGRRKGR